MAEVEARDSISRRSNSNANGPAPEGSLLRDTLGSEDYLKHGPFVSAIAEMLEDNSVYRPSEKPEAFCLGLFAPWGGGKSNAMLLLEHEMRSKKMIPKLLRISKDILPADQRLSTSIPSEVRQMTPTELLYAFRICMKVEAFKGPSAREAVIMFQDVFHDFPGLPQLYNEFKEMKRNEEGASTCCCVEVTFPWRWYNSSRNLARRIVDVSKNIRVPLSKAPVTDYTCCTAGWCYPGCGCPPKSWLSCLCLGPVPCLYRLHAEGDLYVCGNGLSQLLCGPFLRQMQNAWVADAQKATDCEYLFVHFNAWATQGTSKSWMICVG